MPLDKTLRQRLISLYLQSDEPRLAAEQCVLLSAALQQSGDQEAARKSLAEAENLAPEWVSGLNVAEFARERGLPVDTPAPEAQAKESPGGLEVDLSGDLSELFFKDSPAAREPDLGDPSAAAPRQTIPDEFPQEIPAGPAPESMEEQLQEVDFYIRLGFHDEARVKLDEIAETAPGSSELASRYHLLGLEPPWVPSSAPAATAPSSAPAAIAAQAAPAAVAPPSPAIPMPAPVKPEEAPARRGTEPEFQAPPQPEVLPQFDAPPHDESPASEFAAEFAAPERETIQEDSGFSSGRYGENRWLGMEEQPAADVPDEPPEPVPSAEAGPVEPAAPVTKASTEPPPNSMFADLIEEMNSLTDQEIAQEDFETHFSLGTAYREMGLAEDAIKEFQSAVKTLDSAKSPREMIQCCGMLSTCFLEKGMPRSAIRWCQTGLGIRDISSHETMALRYDMGVAHAAAGESDRALECFGQVFGIDPSYRDVARRIDDLKSGLERHAP